MSDVPGVGRNLHDHIAAYGLTWTTQSAGLGYNPFLYTLNPRTYFDWKMYKVQIQDFNSFHFLKSGSIWFNLVRFNSVRFSFVVVSVVDPKTLNLNPKF